MTGFCKFLVYLGLVRAWVWLAASDLVLLVLLIKKIMESR